MARVLLAMTLLLLLLPGTALAHAELKEASPPDGSTVEGTPSEIVGVFTEALADGSTIELRDADNDVVADGGIDASDDTRMLITDLPELDPGTYEVRWKAAADDGHIERDTWTFTVSPAPTPSPTPAPTASAAASASATPAASPAPTLSPTPVVIPSPSPAPETTAGTADALLPIIAGLAIVAIAAGFLLSRRSRPSGRP